MKRFVILILIISSLLLSGCMSTSVAVIDEPLDVSIISNDTGEPVNTQNPLPTNGDSVYTKDIWINQSNMYNFSGNVTDLFDNLHSVVIDNTSNGKKQVMVHFERTIPTTVIGLGSFEGNFSNLKIVGLVSGGIELPLLDQSNDDTKRTTETIFIPAVGFNALRLEFYTNDTISLSNLFILKAQTTLAHLQAISEDTKLVENIESFDGALKVTDGFVHTLFIDRFFSRLTGINTTLQAPAVTNDLFINVTDSTGFNVDDTFIISEDGTEEIRFRILSIVGNIINLDRPLDSNYLTGANVSVTNSNMAVDGSVTPVSFFIQPPLTGDKNVFQMTRFLIQMTHAGVPDDGKFGGIPQLTKGVIIRIKKSNVFQTASIWRDNGDLKTDMYNVDYSDKAPAGEYGTNGRWTVTESGAILEIDGSTGDFLEVIIQDDLTGLSLFEVKSQGRIFGN